jgi:molecular chaperone DnaK
VGIAVGIDFGTSACCVHSAGSAEPAPLPSATGAATTPSCVAYDQAGNAIVGDAAARRTIVDADRTVWGVKRLLGRKLHDPEVTWLGGLSPLDLTSAPNGDAWIRIGDRDRSPSEIAAQLLRHVVGRAAAPVDEVVLTVPALFHERQRRALRDAARIAGMGAVRLLHDTTAAAVAWGIERPARRRLALLDLGAGCLDVSIVEQDGTRFEVVASAGDGLLGGDDFDRRIVELVADEFADANGIDLTEDATALARLFEAARTAKHELATVSRSNPIKLAAVAVKDGEPLDLARAGVTLGELARLCDEELERLGETCAWVLEDCGLGTDDIDELLLCGAMTRLPLVQEKIAFLFRKRPRQLPHPEQVKAKGAAQVARDDRIEVVDVTASSLGIKVRGGRFNPIIARNSRLPAAERKVFASAGGGQLTFELYQGEGELVNDDVYLGRVVIADTAAGRQATLSFALDRDGFVQVSAVDPSGKRDRPLRLQPAGGLDDAEVAALSAAAAVPVPLVAPTSSLPPAPAHSRTSPPARRRSGPRHPLPEQRHRSARPPAVRMPSVPAAGPIEVEADSLVGATLGDRWIVHAVIGEGGMGRVYRARHKVLDRDFAIKVLHPELARSQDLAGRFVREAQAASSIRNPHVIDIVDFGRLEDGTGYFVMEHVAGQTLAELSAAHGALPPALVRDVGMQLADGLAAAHGRGIVHRDLKPENVKLLEQEDGTAVCKILDFGIAKSPTSDSVRITKAGILLGTPCYMAPEQIDGDEVDGRADIYALGALLYELAAGEPPFVADNVVTMLVKHKLDPVVPLRERLPGFPAALDAVIVKCLGKAPGDRFGTARELHAAFEAAR